MGLPGYGSVRVNLTILQDSFNRGELSPKVYRRVEAAFYLDGVKTLINFIAVPRGAAKRRTGFRYLGRVALEDTTKNVFVTPTSVTITTPDVDVTFA